MAKLFDLYGISIAIMRILTISLVVLPLVISCTGNKDRTEGSNSREAAVQRDSVPVSDTIRADVPEETVPDTPLENSWSMMNSRGEEIYQLTVDAAQRQLHIYDLAGNTTQTIDLETDEFIEDEISPHFIDIQDFNFDGMPDFAYRVTGGTGVSWYQYYVRDRSSNRFVKHVALSDIPAVYVDTTAKVLISTSSSYGGGEYSSKYYRPDGLTDLQLIREVHQTLQDELGQMFLFESIAFTDQGEVVECRMEIRAVGSIETHCVLEGKCQHEFIALIGNDQQRLQVVDGPCSGK